VRSDRCRLRVDAALGGQNSEYQTKRKSLRYGAPVIRVVRSGEFDRYRRRMMETGQRADGQFKVLRLTSDTSFAAEFAAERDLVGGARPTLVTENVSPPRGDAGNQKPRSTASRVWRTPLEINRAARVRGRG
jgi:hypothetical protein